jgi:hypothetical protein
MAKKVRKIDLIAKELLACRDARGRLTPSAVWKAAKANPKSVLHGEFEWDVHKAAEEAWENRARELIRMARSIIQLEDRVISFPKFISDVTAAESAYVETVEIIKRGKKAVKKETLEAELTRIKSSVHRALVLAEVFGLSDYFKTMLQTVIDTEIALDEVDDEAA